MRISSHYKIMFSLHLLVMLLFIFVMYVGVYLSHWVTFDIGLFGSICACISTVYYVIMCEKAEKFEAGKVVGYDGKYFEAYFEDDSDEEGEDEYNRYEEDEEYNDYDF